MGIIRVTIIGDKLRDSSGMICMCLMQASKGTVEENFFHASRWPTIEKGCAEEEMDGSTKDKSEKMQPI